MSKGQALLKRNPAMTREEFSEHWYKKHAAIVVPAFLHSETKYYAQIHNPRSTDPSLDISEWDGAAQSIFGKHEDEPWLTEYYKEQILPDERRFLVSEARNHFKVVPAGTIVGDVRVVIEDGKSLIEVPDENWRIFNEYKARGEKKEEDKA